MECSSNALEILGGKMIQDELMFRSNSIDLDMYKDIRRPKRSESDELKDKINSKVNQAAIEFFQEGKKTGWCVIS